MYTTLQEATDSHVTKDTEKILKDRLLSLVPVLDKLIGSSASSELLDQLLASIAEYIPEDNIFYFNPTSKKIFERGLATDDRFLNLINSGYPDLLAGKHHINLLPSVVSFNLGDNPYVSVSLGLSWSSRAAFNFDDLFDDFEDIGLRKYGFCLKDETKKLTSKDINFIPDLATRFNKAFSSFYYRCIPRQENLHEDLGLTWYNPPGLYQCAGQSVQVLSHPSVNLNSTTVSNYNNGKQTNGALIASWLDLMVPEYDNRFLRREFVHIGCSSGLSVTGAIECKEMQLQTEADVDAIVQNIRDALKAYNQLILDLSSMLQKLVRYSRSALQSIINSPTAELSSVFSKSREERYKDVRVELEQIT